MKFVNVYEVSSCYGGPEEGGWWFPSGELVKAFGPFENDDAHHIAADLRKGEWEQVNKKYQMGFHSQDGAGPDGEPDDGFLMRGGAWGSSSIHVYVQDNVGAPFFPDEIPRYE